MHCMKLKEASVISKASGSTEEVLTTDEEKEIGKWIDMLVSSVPLQPVVWPHFVSVLRETASRHWKKLINEQVGLAIRRLDNKWDVLISSKINEWLKPRLKSMTVEFLVELVTKFHFISSEVSERVLLLLLLCA